MLSLLVAELWSDPDLAQAQGAPSHRGPRSVGRVDIPQGVVQNWRSVFFLFRNLILDERGVHKII